MIEGSSPTSRELDQYQLALLGTSLSVQLHDDAMCQVCRCLPTRLQPDFSYKTTSLKLRTPGVIATQLLRTALYRLQPSWYAFLSLCACNGT